MNEETLDQLEEMSSLMLPTKDIAIMLEIEHNSLKDFLSDHDDDPWKRFQKGRLKMITQVRKSVFELATNGSSPAQTEAMRLIRDAEMDNV